MKQKKLLQIGKSNVAVSGDTFDRVAAILEKDNSLDYISIQKQQLTIVVGSSWPKDETIDDLSTK
jgi:3-deoxy-D-manno-octulosonic-acid transferase